MPLGLPQSLLSPSGTEYTSLNTVVRGSSAPTLCSAMGPVGDGRLERASLAHRQTAFPRVRLFLLLLPQRCLVSLIEEGNLWAVVTESSSCWAFHKLSLKIIRIQKLKMEDVNWGSTRPINFCENSIISSEIVLRLIAKPRDRATPQQLHQIVYGKFRTYLNKIFKDFQIPYYILPVCLCFGKTCTDTAESKIKK